MANPLGIQTRHPRLSWALEASTDPPAREATQHAYRIECFQSASASGPPLWDSGRVAGASQLHIKYAGPRLNASQRVWWRVTSWEDKKRKRA